MNQIKFFALLLFFCCRISIQYAQNLSFDRLPDELSISNTTVRTMLQDSKGFLWFGTWYGLYRYDGYNLRKFKVTAHLATENIGSKIVSLCEGRDGSIWIGTQNSGLYQFNRETEQFKAFQHNENDEKSIASNQVYAVIEDKKGRVWVGTHIGIDLFENGSFKHFKNTPLSKVEVRGITQARDGSLCCATSNGVYKCIETVDSSFIMQYFNVANPNEIGPTLTNPYNFCHALLEDPLTDNVFWIATNRGLKKIDVAKNQRVAIADLPNYLSNSSIYTLLSTTISNNHTLWFGTDYGLFRFDLTTGRYEHFQENLKDEQAIRNNNIHSLYEDHSGLLWIGTDKGVNKLNLQKKGFEKIDVGNKNNITCITNADNTLWVGSFGQGISKLTFENGQPKIQYFSFGNTANFIYDLRVDSEGMLWAATRGGGIFKINPKQTSDFKQYSEATGLSDNYIMTVFEDSHHVLWFGTWDHGLIRYDRSSNRFENILYVPNSSFKLNEHPIVRFYEFKNTQNERILWAGTRGGGVIEMVLSDSSTILKVNTVYRNSPQNPQTLANNFITCFLKDAANQIWIGTEEGLSRGNSDKKTFHSYFKKDGLPDDNIQAILEDDNRNLWISTNKGLSKVTFDKNQRLISRNYDEKDGLPSNYFQSAAAYKLNDKQLFFGSTNGLLAFYPDHIKDNVTVPMVSLVDFKLFNQSISAGEIKDGRILLPLSINAIKTIELDYKDNAFAIEFAALHFYEPDKNRYAYRLIGFNDKWIYANANERTAHYTNLPHGMYVFEVKASNNDGVWSTDVARVNIVVHPPFWLSWWAYLIYLAGIIGAIGLYRRIILTRENLKNQVKMETFKREQSEEISKMKVRFFTNISHELRTPLTLILSPLEELTKRADMPPSVHQTFALMERNATRLFNLITELLDFRKTEEGLMTLQAVETDIVKYLTNITLAFRDLAQKRHIDFSLVATFATLKLWFDRDLMEKVFFNLFSNAFKYTPDGGKITVQIDLDEQRNVVITIQDTGIGIAEEELSHIFEEFYRGKTSLEGNLRQGSGIGLALTKNIIDLHKSTISVESKVNKGSKFTISIPLGHEHYDPKFVNYDYKSSEDLAFYPVSDAVQVEKAPPQYESPKTADKTDKTTQPLVLIIEDNPDIRAFIKLNLSPFYQIEEAENGQAGLEKAQQLIPDLIISDIIMPKMDGLALCRSLKNSESTSHIPIILLTARSSQIYQIEGYETGADDYVTKPFNMTLLLTKIKSLLENRTRIQQRFDKGFTQTVDFEIKPSELNISHLDKVFLEKCITLIEKHIEDNNYSVEQMSQDLLISPILFYRKIKALTGDTPIHFIRIIRIKRAAQLLEKGFSVSEATYKVGFQDLKYFRKCFKEQFGVNPSEFVVKVK